MDITTLFGYTKAVFRPTFEYVTLLNNYINRTENTERLNTDYETNNFWSLFYYYFTSPIEIIPNLYLGNIINAGNFEQLKLNEIDTIVNVTEEHECYFPNDFTYYKIPLKDAKGVKIPNNFAKHTEKIHKELQNNKKVLIHCHHGRSRSVALLVMYLMRYYSTQFPTFNEAYQHIKNLKPIANINIDFVNQITNQIKYFS